jgi:DNA-binding transcriptional LysR family regulator
LTSEHVYKEATFPQLRSFCETARLGSFTAAAAALGLSHPTVWKQVHALERDFGAKLVLATGRGCRLTSAGRLLAELAMPTVATIAALKSRFQQSLTQVQSRLAISTTQRILVEDLLRCLLDLTNRRPEVTLTFQELTEEHVLRAVETGEADLGLLMESSKVWDDSRLVFEPSYQLDIVLVTPPDHPLARRRRLSPRDLSTYPLANDQHLFVESALDAALKHWGVFDHQPQRIDTLSAVTIRRCVELGLGIGLVPQVPLSLPRAARLHVRLMSRYFGRPTVYSVYRRDAPSEAALDFAGALKAKMRVRKAR